MEAIWNANPTINMLFCFEDGNCFEKLSDAASYAKTTGQSYKQVSRPVVETEIETEHVEETETLTEHVEEQEIKTKPTKKSNK